MEAAFGICTNPGLVHDRGTILSEIGQRNKDALIALLALREFHVLAPSFHCSPPLLPLLAWQSFYSVSYMKTGGPVKVLVLVERLLPGV